MIKGKFKHLYVCLLNCQTRVIAEFGSPIQRTICIIILLFGAGGAKFVNWGVWDPFHPPNTHTSKSLSYRLIRWFYDNYIYDTAIIFNSLKICRFGFS